MAISIIRTAILIALASISTALVISAPADNSTTWLFDLFSSKLIGIYAGWLCIRCYRRWANTDFIIGAFRRWADKASADLL